MIWRIQSFPVIFWVKLTRDKFYFVRHVPTVCWPLQFSLWTFNKIFKTKMCTRPYEGDLEFLLKIFSTQSLCVRPRFIHVALNCRRCCRCQYTVSTSPIRLRVCDWLCSSFIKLLYFSFKKLNLILWQEAHNHMYRKYEAHTRRLPY